MVVWCLFCLAELGWLVVVCFVLLGQRCSLVIVSQLPCISFICLMLFIFWFLMTQMTFAYQKTASKQQSFELSQTCLLVASRKTYDIYSEFLYFSLSAISGVFKSQ